MKRLQINRLTIVLVGIFVTLLFVYFSEVLHSLIGLYVIRFVPSSLKLLIILIALTVVLESVKNLIDKALQSKSWQLRDTLVDNSCEKFTRYMEQNAGNIPCQTLSQLMVAFYDDELYLSILAEFKIQYELNESLRPLISYFLSDNRDDGDVVRFFSNNKKLKNDCEKLSRDIVTKTISDLYDSSVQSICFVDFDEIFIGLLHVCLPQNHVPKDRIIYVLRTFLSLVKKEISEENYKEHQSEISQFLILLPLIQIKIAKAKMDNKYLNKEIADIYKLKWSRLVLKNACKQITDNYKNDNGFYCSRNQCTYDAGIISVHSDQISIKKKIELYCAIKRCNDGLASNYSDFAEDDILSLITSSTVFGQTDRNNDEFMKECMSFIYLCASAPFSPINKVGGCV